MARQDIVATTVYKFSELSEDAQAKALDSFRGINTDFGDWYDAVYEDAKTCGEILGIDMAHKSKDPCIWFSGFSSQGDGACFEGSYAYAKGALAAIKKHAPSETALHSIAQDLQDAQRSAFYKLSARVTHRGHYYHEMCTDIEVFNDTSGDYATGEQTTAVKEALRDFMRWIYRSLEKEYEYLSSDECIRESIEANEYEFTESGAQY